MGYLISLHDNEVDWNLLGIKIVGVKEALPIPAGDYEYGDAYMIGNETDGYKMYIWTRPDGEVHKEAYWFPLGRFPVPGPQGPKGDGLEQIVREASNTAQSVSYDSTSGATIEYTDKTLLYKDSTTGETKTQTYPAQLSLPILPGKYISMDANADNDALEVKVDDTALALDYWKINKAVDSAVPLYQNGKADLIRAVTAEQINTLARRDANGDCSFNRLVVNALQADSNGAYRTTMNQLYFSCADIYFTVVKTATDTGTLGPIDFTRIKTYPNIHIIYDNQVYILQDPNTAPDGTLNYIHIDSIQDGNSGYTMTGKCFSVTVSTRAWQVVDLNFGKDYTHNIYMDDPASGVSMIFTVQSKRSTAYESISDLAAVVQRIGFISCVVEPGTGTVKAGYITADNTKFTVKTDAEYNYTFNQVTIQDTIS